MLRERREPGGLAIAQSGTLLHFDAALSAAMAHAPGGNSAIVRRISAQTAQNDSALIAKWDDLAVAASEPNPFLESWYLLPALAYCQTADESAALLLVEQDGVLIGLLPITRTARHGRWPLTHLEGWHHPNAFLGTPLVRAGHEAAFWQALLATLDDCPDAGLFFHLRSLDAAGPVATALQAVCAAEKRPCGIVHREERAFLQSALAPDVYAEAALRGKKRKELRRQMARLKDQGSVRFQKHDDGNELDDWIASFLALEASGWKGRVGSALASAPGTRQLFVEALHGAAAHGRLQRLAHYLDDQPIAMLANFITLPGSFSYKTAFDERYARFSPGVLLQLENLALLNQPGLEWADSCAAADHPMIDSIWMERRSIARYSIGIGSKLRRTVFAGILATEQARMKARQP